MSRVQLLGSRMPRALCVSQGARVSRAGLVARHSALVGRQYSTKDVDDAVKDGDEGEIKIEFKLEPLPRPNEDTETKRARLLYQSRKRGILETDLLLSRFAKKYLATMTRAELDEYDELLDQPDWDIYYWATRNNDVSPCPERWEKSSIMAQLRDLSENKEREVMRMPDL